MEDFKDLRVWVKAYELTLERVQQNPRLPEGRNVWVD